MFSSVESMLDHAKSKIGNLRTLPMRAIAEGEKIVMQEVPVYTSTLEQAIEITHDDSGAEIHLTAAGLLASARINAVDFIARANENRADIPGVGNMTPEDYIESGGGAYYPEVIEEQGSPKQDKGQGMWAKTSQVVGEFVATEVSREARS